MAKLSRNARHKARVRKNLSQARQVIRDMNQQLQQARVLLVLALAQAGGTVVVSKGTGETTFKNLMRLGFKTESPKDDRKELDYVTIMLTEQEEAPAVDPSADGVTIEHIEDETADPFAVDAVPDEE